MNAYAKIAQIHGKVDPKDEAAVQQFFEATFPTLSPAEQQEIVDELFFETTGLGPDTAHQEGQSTTTHLVPFHNLLTHLENQVLQRIADGQTNSQITRSLGLSRSAFKNVIASIWTKIDIGTKAVIVLTQKSTSFNALEPIQASDFRALIEQYLHYINSSQGSAESSQLLNELATSRYHRS